MSNPVLSICIPTYNREKYIKRLLSSIVCQQWFSEEIEILVYDDPSSDNTEEVVKNYIKKFNNIKYHRNEYRLGMMPSILDSILKCTWKYIWLFGSDDMIWPHALKTVLFLINKEKPDLIFNKYWDINKISDVEKKINYKNYLNFVDFCHNVAIDREKTNDIKSIDHAISYFSYMSIYCFRRDVFNESYFLLDKKWKKKYLNTHYFNYIYILFSSKKINKICLLNSPILTYNQWWNISWKLNLKIVKDVISIFNIIKKNYKISRESNKLFIKILFIWVKWFLNSQIFYFYPIKLLRNKFPKTYNKMLSLYKCFLKNK